MKSDYQILPIKTSYSEYSKSQVHSQFQFRKSSFFRMDERIIKREVINASIDVHPTMPALVIDYDEVNILLTHNGREVATEPTSHSKTIRLQGFDGQTDIHQLAEEIVAKCNLVNPVRLPEIEQLLHYLQNRRDTYQQSTNQKQEDAGPQEEAHFADIDTYVDLLYEEIEDKERAASLILQLARNPEYLEELLHKETVLTALARVLREDWNRSMQLRMVSGLFEGSELAESMKNP